MTTRTAGVTKVMMNMSYGWDQIQDPSTGWMYDSVMATKVIQAQEIQGGGPPHHSKALPFCWLQQLHSFPNPEGSAGV